MVKYKDSCFFSYSIEWFGFQTEELTSNSEFIFSLHMLQAL